MCRRYNFYDHKVSVRLMPLERMVRWTKELRTGLATQGASAVHEVGFATWHHVRTLLPSTACSLQVLRGEVDDALTSPSTLAWLCSVR